MRFNYNALLDYLDTKRANRPISLTFSDINRIAGTPIPNSYIEQSYLNYSYNPFRRKMYDNGYDIEVNYGSGIITFR